MLQKNKLTKVKPTPEAKRGLVILDAKQQILGRLAAKISLLLQGKNKAGYNFNLVGGDYVVVKNAKDIKVTGYKAFSKTYTHYSGYPGGLRVESFAALKQKNPGKLIRLAVSGMLPKNKLRARYLKNLFVYSGSETQLPRYVKTNYKNLKNDSN